MQQASKVTHLKRSRPAKVSTRPSNPPKPRPKEVQTAPVPSASANVKRPGFSGGSYL